MLYTFVPLHGGFRLVGRAEGRMPVAVRLEHRMKTAECQARR